MAFGRGLLFYRPVTGVEHGVGDVGFVFLDVRGLSMTGREVGEMVDAQGGAHRSTWMLWTMCWNEGRCRTVLSRTNDTRPNNPGTAKLK